MACYFDEHDCEPLPDGQAPDHLLHLARLLIDGGYAAMSDLEFDRIFQSSKSPPPASKGFVEGLKTLKASDLQVQQKCPICISEYDENDEVIKLPCLHSFHAKCIIPWLNKTSSCPLCRHEFPTDDEAYEEYKKQKAREKQRQFELESLHNSMFG